MENEARIIAIGDIHGCVNALDAVLDAAALTPKDRVIVLGDFIDQGAETRLVIERLLLLQAQCRLVCLMGNHEEMLLAALRNSDARKYWEACGGISTLNSYFFGATIDVLPADHLRFVESCVDSYETDHHLFVHANYEPHLPLADQQPHTLRWDLLDPAAVQPHCSGKRAIVGHTEQQNGEILDLDCVCCIDTACWRYGWLTALSVTTGQVWQASRFGHLRTSAEPPVGPLREVGDEA